jgi:hypothetical protein
MARRQFGKIAKLNRPYSAVLDFFQAVFEEEWGVIPTRPENPQEVKKRDRAKRVVAQWMCNFEDRAEHELIGEEGTVWSGLQAITRWADHEQTVRRRGGVDRSDARTYSRLWGTAAGLKSKAHKRAMVLIAD